MRILIVDTLRASYQSLKEVLQAEPDITVVGFAPTAEEALHRADYCDVALVSESLAQTSTLQLVRQLVNRAPQVKVLITGLSEEADSILQFVEAGASGYILKQESGAAMLQKVRAAHRNKAVVSPQVAASLMAHLAALSMRVSVKGVRREQYRFEELTPREREVLDLLAEELSNQQIANRLHIQVGTVKNHVHHILKKLNASNRHEAAAAYMLRLKHGGASGVYAT